MARGIKKVTEEVQGRDLTTGPIKNEQKEKDRADKLMEALKLYKESKAPLDTRIVENDRWYRSLHWDILREQAGQQKDDSKPEPVTAYLWNTLANRHGDMMDAFPEPVFTEREVSDKETADILSKVVKVILDRNKFRKTYSNNAWRKVKGGASIYHISWDQSLENGIGDISVKKTDILRLYWEPGVEDIQDSKYVFALAMVDSEQLRQKYPVLKENDTGTGGINVQEYSGKDRNALKDKTLVIDCYSKEIIPPLMKPTLHLDKIVSGMIVETTRTEKFPKGLYEHGLFPFVVDVLFPEEDSVVGFGFVDIIKNPQMYIDKLDAILMKNALVAGKQRVIYKDGGGIDPTDLADLSKDFIKSSSGKLKEGEDYAILQSKSLGADIMNHRQQKIMELKEISGTSDFSRGSTTNGVTSGSAIMALQEASNKLARAMNSNTYDAHTQICYQVLELIREKYDTPRLFRITKPNEEKATYVPFDNSTLKEQPMAQVVTGMDPEMRKPIFDIVVHAEKYSPYAALANNEIAKEMFTAGFFNPEMASAALIALDMMSFDGKETVVKNINAKYQEAMAIQKAQADAQNNVGINQDLMMQMNELIKKLTGKDMLAGANIGQGGTTQAPQQGRLPQ